MWVGLDAVEWAGLKHNYGSAEDIPDLLRRCGGPHPDDAHDASSELLNLLFHQGGWVCSAASAALPFVLRLASTPQVPTRCAMLELVAMPAAEAPRIEARFLDPGWAPAWKQALPELLSLLDDPEPEIRRATADVLGVCDSPGESVLPGLLRCWEAEDDPATRLDLVLALGKAALRAPVGRHSAEVFDLLHGLLDSPQAQIRLAAVHALAPDDPALPVRRLDLMLEAVRDPTVELWRHTSSVHTGVLGVHLWAARLIPGPAPRSRSACWQTITTANSGSVPWPRRAGCCLSGAHRPLPFCHVSSHDWTIPPLKPASGRPSRWPASARRQPPTPTRSPLSSPTPLTWACWSPTA